MSSNPNQQRGSCCNALATLHDLLEAVKVLQTGVNDIQRTLDTIRPVIASSQPLVVRSDQSSSTPARAATTELEEESDKKEACPYQGCDKRYIRVSSLLRHFERHVSCTEKCVLCDRVVTSVENYQEHFRICIKNDHEAKAIQHAHKQKDRLSKHSRSVLYNMRLQVDQENNVKKRKVCQTEPGTDGQIEDLAASTSFGGLTADTGQPPIHSLRYSNEHLNTTYLENQLTNNLAIAPSVSQLSSRSAPIGEHIYTTRHTDDNIEAPLGQLGLVEEPLRTETDAIPIERQIEYKFSEAHITRVHLLHEPLLSAIHKSKQWKWERAFGGATTDCLNILSPKNRDQDISIIMVVGFEEGMQLVEDLDLKKAR